VKTSVERVDDTTVKLSVTVEADRVTKAIDEAARHLAGEVKIPGFRPGKAPRRVLESRLGKETIVQEAVRESLPAFYTEAAREAELDVVGPPEFDVDTFADGQDATFSATVEVRPEVGVPDFAGLQVPHPEWEVTDEELDQQLDGMRERFAELETVKRPIQVGDHVRVTVNGSRNGEPVPDASADDVLYEVSDPEDSGSELDRNLVGAEAGAILKFNDVLGADYGELAGEELSFTAIVKEVKARKLPDLDDEFAVTASEFDTIDELRDDLRTQLQQQKTAYARQALRGRVVEAVCEQVEVPLPNAMIQQEVRYRLNMLAQQAQQYGLELEQYLEAAGADLQQLLGQFEDEAKQTVKAQLVVDAIGRDAGIEIKQEDLGEEVARQSARMGRSPEEIAQIMTHPENIGALISDTFRRKSIDHILAQVQVLSAPPEDEPAPAAEPAPEEETSAADPAEVEADAELGKS
jgi:trigger factor